jgi:hypothetical protein
MTGATNPERSVSMLRLGFILHLFIGSTLAGSAVIAALVMGFDTLRPILIAAALGFVVAVPVTWLVTKKLYETR